MTTQRAPRLVENASEGALLDAIRELARWRGWLVHHDPPSQRRDGSWSTAVHGDIGFPDLVLAPRTSKLPERLPVFAELKTTRGAVTYEQRDWIEALRSFVWRPADYASGSIDAYLMVRTEKDAQEVARLAGWVA